MLQKVDENSENVYFSTLGGNVFFYTWWKCFFSTLGGNGSNFCQEVSVRPQKVQELHSPNHRNLTFHLWDSNLIRTTLSDFFLSKEGISKHTQTTFQPEAESNMK